MSSELLEQFSEIQKQQKESAESLAVLVRQYQGWQQSLEALLDKVSLADVQPIVGHPSISGTRNVEALQGDPDEVASSAQLDVPKEGRDDDKEDSEDKEESKLRSVLDAKPMLRSESQKRLKNLVAQGIQDVLDETNGTPKTFRDRVADVVNTQGFEISAGFIIMVNLVTIGIEVQVSVQMGAEFGNWSWPWVMERFFLLLYCMEATLRYAAIGNEILKDLWYLTDLALLFVGFLALLVLPLSGVDGQSAEKLLIVRGLRLLRLVRALRMFSHFKVIWRLVYGLLNAGQTIMSTTFLILVSLFVFACVAMELIAKDRTLLDRDITKQIVNENFNTIFHTMWTLMQFVTLDSVAAIYFPLIEVRPYLSFFFLPLVVIVSIGLMNLVTAAVLENAMESAAADAEEERSLMMNTVKDAVPELLEIFKNIDKDQSGILTVQELESVEVDVLPKKFLKTVHVGNMIELFEFLDVDQTGELSREEFIEGLLDLCLREMPLHSVQSLKLLHLIHGVAKRIDLNIEAMRAHQAANPFKF
mmetsp:Transcript_41187/g.76570  ORF Transcript_41187/g.76570 Transcript_41187/m.76570 type:complete len:531 (-) Transcript_41187:204-1796(-)